jgi:hypothetical protein
MFRRAKQNLSPFFWGITKKAKKLLLLVFVFCVFILFEKASAIPNSINYQARLRDNLGVPISTSTTIQFSIYNHLSGGSSGDAPSAGGPLLWKETYDQSGGACAQIIPDAQGYLTLTLGDCTAFPSYLDFSSGTYYLGVKIAGDAEASPRVKLNAHPYALNSDRVDGFHATSTATAGQLLALGDDLSFDIGAGVYSGASINLTSTTATSSIAGNLNVIGNATFATATIDNLIISGASSFTDISWTNATGTNLYLASNLNVAGDSYFGTIASGTWNGSIIAPAYGGTGQDTSGWDGLIRLTAGVWSTTTIDLTGDVNGILPIANGGTNASSFSPYEFVWFNGSSLIASGFSSTSFMATGTDNWVNITGDTMTGPLVINSDLSVTGTSTLATTTISTLRLGDDFGFPTDAPVLVSYKQYTDLSLFEFFPAHAFLVDLFPATDSSSTIDTLISLRTNENSTTNFDLNAGAFIQAIHSGSGVVGATVGTLSVAELASATGSINFAVGIAGQVNNGIENPAFSGAINNAVAVLAMIENGMGGGTIGNAVGFMSNITIDGGVINNVYGARINNPTSNSASGTIGELYGLFIEEQNFGSTSNFNIYSDGTSSINYFGGFVGIGTSSPLAKLDVYGDLVLSGVDRYLNFNTATGSDGYGIRDYNGKMQFKHSNGTWADIYGKVNHTINVAQEGGDFDNLNDAVDFANTVSYDVIIQIYPGEYTVSSTLEITNPYIKGIHGLSQSAVIVQPASSMVSAGDPIFDFNFTTDTIQFAMSDFTIDGSNEPSFKNTTGCDAIQISSEGVNWIEMERMYIADVNRGIDLSVANLVDAFHVDFYNMGNAGVYIDNGGILQIESSYMEESDTYYAYIDSTTGASEFYMVGSEFGSYNDNGTGLYIAGDNSYAEIRYSNMWGLDYNIITNDSSVTKVTASYLQKALTLNIDQRNDSTINISSSDGAFSSTDISINNPDNVYFYALAEEEGTVLFGRHDNIDQDIIKVDTGQAFLPKLAYRADYYGNSGLLFINDNAGEQTMLGVQATSSWAKLSAMTGDRDAGSALFLYSDTDDFGTTSSLRGWAMARSGADANLIFSFQNSDSGDGKPDVVNNRVMELDGFNTQMLVKGGAVFNTSSGNYNFLVKGAVDSNLLFVQGSTDRIGIGTSTPGYKLTVQGDVNITGNYRVNGTILTPVNYGTLAGQTLYWTGSAWSPTSSLFVASNGFVGIGTTTPLNALSIAGGINLASGTPANTAYALYNNAGQLYWNGMPVMGGSTSTFIQDVDGDTIVSVESSPDEDWIRFMSAGTERMVITNEGRIGIGTSTPGMVDLEAHYLVDIEMSSNTNSGIRLANLSAGNGASTEINFYNDASQGGVMFLAGSNFNGFPNLANAFGMAATAGNDLLLAGLGGNIRFVTFNQLTSGSSSLYIVGSGANEGFVGINTSSPLSQLDVYGNIILSATDPYINFGTTTASSGYGFRVHDGLVEVKHLNNNHNVWSEIVTMVALTEGGTIYVNGVSGNDSFDGESPAKAKKTISAAITTATASATATNTFVVKVSAGTYTENISMADHIRLEGGGRNTIINGTVTFNISVDSVMESVHIISTNDYAIKQIGTGRTTLINVFLEATFDNDAAVQATVYQDNGLLYILDGSEVKMTRSNNAAGAKINTIYYLSGSNLVRSNIFSVNHTIITYDSTDDLSLVYSDNTNSGSVAVVKDPVVNYFTYAVSPANIIKNIYHNGSSLNSYVDNGFITAVAVMSGTPKFMPAYIANSGSTSTINIRNAIFNWAGAGMSENNVYLGAAITKKDTISLVENSFSTVNDIFPVIYTADGASGTIKYFVENGYGNLQNTAFSTYDGSFGIGTTTPYDRLEVWGDDLSYSATSSRNYITIVANGNGEAGNYVRRVNSGSYDNGWSWYMPVSSTDFRLWDDSVGAEGDDVFTIQAGTGHIGIGTALYEPLNLLHVDGGIYLGDTATATSTYSIYNVGGDLYWNGNLLASAGGATANWILTNHNGGDVLSTSTTIPVWFKDIVYASSSLYVDGILSVLGSANLATTTMTNASANYLTVNNIVTTTNLIATGYITLGGVARNTWPSGGGGDSSWATTSANILYPSLTPPYALVIGGSATSSNVIFEVVGDSYMSGDLNVGGSLTVGDNFQADYFTAVSTTAVSYLGGGLVLGDPNATGITGYERIILSDDIGAFSDFSFKVAGNGYPVFNLGSSGGTTAAPTLKGAGNYGGLDFYGYDGANWQKSGGILGQSDGTPALNSMPGKIVFSTTPNGSTTALERMAIDSRGWIGMGTTTPSAPLHVVTATSGPAMTILQKTIAGATNLNFVTNNNKYWQLSKRDAIQDDKFIFYFVDDAGIFNNVFTLGATGTVGINNENPNAMLSITGTSTYPLLNIMTSSSATGMYISNIGNVGIGTTDPNYYKLRVYAEDSDVSAEVKTASSSKVALFNIKAGSDVNFLQIGYYGSTTPGFAGIPPASAVWDSVAPGGSYFINEASGAPLVFMTDGWQAVNERMRITGAGFVGIGTSTPLSKLHIDYGDIRISSGTESWIAGPNAFPNRAGSTGLIGLNMVANSSTWHSGLFTEVGGRLLSYGINATQLGDRNTSTIGAIFRLDTRDNTPYWSIKRQVAGGSVEYSDMQIAQTGEVGFGGHANDTNTFAGQVHILSAASTTVGLVVQGAVNQTAALQQWLNSAGATVGEAKYLSQNFGMSMETGALIQLNSYVGEEFMRNRGNITFDTGYAWGDFQQFNVDENADCTWSTVNNAVNGIGRQTGGAGSSCLAYHGSAIGTAHTIFNANNLPVLVMKISPSAVSVNARFRVGASNLAQAQSTDPLNGLYFTNNGTAWRGVTRRAGASTNVECTGQTVQTAVFGVGKIEVVSSNGDGTGVVKFYVDNDTSNGINWTYCGESTTNIPTVGLTSMIMGYSTAAYDLDIDYYRVWQDDSNVVTGDLEIIEEESEEELTVEDRLLILELSASTTAEQIESINMSMEENISQIENLGNTVNALDVSLSETKSMLDALNERVVNLETGAVVMTQSIADLNNMITDFDLRLAEIVSSSLGLEYSGSEYDNLLANVLIITDSALFDGSISVKKHASFGEDTVGQGLILAGHTSTTITFAEPYELLPIVNITPIDYDGKWKLSEITTTGFKILISEPQLTDVTFNWQVFGARSESKIFYSDGTVKEIGLIINYIPEPVIVEEPIAEESPTEEPIAEEPTDEPVIEDPVAEPVTEEPIVEESPTEEPIAEEPTDEPVIEDPVAEPVVEEPIVEESSVIESSADEPIE